MGGGTSAVLAAIAAAAGAGATAHLWLRPRLQAQRPHAVRPWSHLRAALIRRWSAPDAQAFSEQLESTLVAVAQASRAGLGTLPALAAAEAGDIVGPHWAAALRRYDAGMPLVEAFAVAGDTAIARAFRALAAVLAAHAQAGGPLAPALLALCESLRQRRALAGELDAQTADARMTAWALGLAVPGLALIIGAWSPELLQPLVAHPIGRLAVAAVAGWWCVGVLLARRLLRAPELRP